MAFARGLAPHAYDLVFADPPYGTDASVQLAELWLGTPFSTVIGIEHARAVAMPAGGDTRRYGDTRVTFYR